MGNVTFPSMLIVFKNKTWLATEFTTDLMSHKFIQYLQVNKSVAQHIGSFSFTAT